MELATINDPTNTDLYTGYAILNNVALSPLMLAAMGLLGRLLEDIRETHDTKLHPMILRVVQLVILVGLILGIVGGVDAADAYIKALGAGSTAAYTPGSLNKAGTALFVIAYVALAAFTIAISFQTPYAQAGEKRLLYAVAFALPFLLVRLVYSCFSTFSHNLKFNLLAGDETVLLCMAYLMELPVVIVFEVTGLSLRKVVKVPRPTRLLLLQHIQPQPEIQPPRWRRDCATLYGLPDGTPCRDRFRGYGLESEEGRQG